MIHAGELLRPSGLGLGDTGFSVLTALIARAVRQPRENAFGNFLGIADDADGDFLGQSDAVGIDIDLNDLGIFGPVVDAVARQRRERVEARAEAEHHVGVRNELHRRLGSVVAQRSGEKRVRAGEGIVVLVANADRRGQALGQLHRSRDCTAKHHACPVEDDRVLGPRQQRRRFIQCGVTTGGALKLDDFRQLDVDHLRPEIARHVDLSGCRGPLGVQDHAIEHLGHAGRIAHLFLVGDHVLEQFHLLDFLETALPDGLVRGLRRDQQKRCVVPVCGLHRRHEVGDAGAILRNHHRHLAGGAGVAICHHATRSFMGAVPEGDPRFREDVGDRHEGRANDPERMFDTMHLEDFYECFFGGHFHGGSPGMYRWLVDQSDRAGH